MYSHDYEGNGGKCTALVPKYNYDQVHPFPWDKGRFCLRCNTDVMYEDYGSGAGRSFCQCKMPYNEVPWVCKEDMKDEYDVIHARLTDQPCNADSWSVLHPPQGHWCEALENGWDCMHFEEQEGAI
jgi:hypothetical protein